MSEHYFDNYEWLKARLGRFTASEGYKLFVGSKKKGELFGVGAQTYIKTKAAELLTMEVKQDMDFKQSEWADSLEAEAVTEFELITKLKGTYYGVGNPTFFRYGDYAGCSPDWEIEGREGADIKCPYNSAEHVRNLLLASANDFKKERWEYYCQGQMSMLIRGWKKFHFVSYDPRMVEKKLRLKILTVYPDQEWRKKFEIRLNAAIEEVKSILFIVDLSTLKFYPLVHPFR
jgi:hypothetical protein